MSHHTQGCKPPSIWRRNLAVIFITELIAITGFAVALPILPLYVRELGVQDEQQVKIWSGIIFSAHAVAMTISAPIWGTLSDRYGRKIMVERAMFSGAVLLGLMGFAQNVWQLALLRVLAGVFTGTVTAANALVATSAPRNRVGYAMGLLQMAVYTGASAGPFLGGIVGDTLGYRAAFWITGGLLLTAGLGVLFLVKESFEPAARRGPPSNPGGSRQSLVQLGREYLTPILSSSALRSILSVRLAMYSGARLQLSVMPLFVETLLPPNARVASISGSINGISAFAGALGALGLGRLGDRTGYRWILVGCAVISCLCYAPHPFVDSPTTLALLQAGTGLAMGGVLASISALLAQHAPPGQEGIVYGIDASVISITNTVGPMTGSTLAALFNLRTPFLVAAIVFAMAGVVASRLLPRD